jgi:hypothetical protein
VDYVRDRVVDVPVAFSDDVERVAGERRRRWRGGWNGRV